MTKASRQEKAVRPDQQKRGFEVGGGKGGTVRRFVMSKLSLNLKRREVKDGSLYAYINCRREKLKT